MSPSPLCVLLLALLPLLSLAARSPGPLLAEGAQCGRALRCGPGMECVRGGAKTGVCVCKSREAVCGSDGKEYLSACALRTANANANANANPSIQQQPITIKNKGRCATAPQIVSPPGAVFNVSGSAVYLSCEAIGVPTPVLTWSKVVNGRRRVDLLPGDRDNLAVQTRGGPEKHEVTGWVLISPLTEAEAGSYECQATNSEGKASAAGSIHLVTSQEDITARAGVKKDEEL